MTTQEPEIFLEKHQAAEEAMEASTGFQLIAAV